MRHFMNSARSLISQVRPFLEVSVFLTVASMPGAHAASPLGIKGPLLSDETGNWKDYRTGDEAALLSEASDEAVCRSKTTSNLRQLYFEHFRYYVDHSKSEISDTEIARFAKVLGMTPYESSNATAVVTDMHYKGGKTSTESFRADNPKSDPGKPGLRSRVATVDKLLNLKGVKYNFQTNFGLVQMSADQLTVSNTGKIVRKMIEDMKVLYASHPEDVIDRCGAQTMFEDDLPEIRSAFDKLQTCDVGTDTSDKVKCFGRWAMLCPNFNISVALLATPRYFATKHRAPLCSKSFRRILKTGRADGGIKPGVKPVVKPVVKTVEKPAVKPAIKTVVKNPTPAKPAVKPPAKKSTPTVASADGFQDAPRYVVVPTAGFQDGAPRKRNALLTELFSNTAAASLPVETVKRENAFADPVSDTVDSEVTKPSDSDIAASLPKDNSYGF